MDILDYYNQIVFKHIAFQIDATFPSNNADEA